MTAPDAAPTPEVRPTRTILLGLLPYLRPYRARIAVALACVVVAKLFNLLMPQALKYIVDDLNGPQAMLAVPIALLLAYGGARVAVTLFTELRQIVFARVMARAARQITLQVFRHLMDLGLRFHLARRTGGVARDVERGGKAIADLLDWTLYSIIPILLEVLLVTLVLVWSYDWRFAAVTLITLALYGAWTIAITEWRTRYYRESVEADTRANESAVDSLLNYETVKYFNNETHEAARYDTSLRRLEDTQVKSITTLAVLNLGQSVIVAGGVTAMMALAALGVVQGDMTVGDLVLVNAYLLQLSAPLFLLGMMYREVKQALTNTENLFRLLDQPREIQDRPGARDVPHQPPEIRFQHVDFHYESRRQILHDVDFVIPAGGTVAVVGHSGSGKSTLARLLYRFYDVTDGSITLDGQDLRDLRQDALRGAIAIVPQDTVLFNDTIGYNIGYARPGATQLEIEAAARAAHIHTFIESLPDGYDTLVGERGLKLSGGEKQRVAIARALLKQPVILIFDEATSALDSASERSIQNELDRIRRNRSTLIVAHRLSTIQHADLILVMERGRVIERGTHSELMREDGHYAQMWRLQQQRAAEEENAAAELPAPDAGSVGTT